MGTQQPKDSCCKMIMKFLFSHIGLCAMVILYCVAGGFIFEHLEKNNEEQVRGRRRKSWSITMIEIVEGDREKRRREREERIYVKEKKTMKMKRKK